MVTDNLRRRVDASIRSIPTYHPRVIRNARYEAVVRASAELEKRVLRLERLIRRFQDALFGLTSGFAFAAVMYFGDASFWSGAIASAILAFVVTIWIASILFGNGHALNTRSRTSKPLSIHSSATTSIRE